MAIAVASTSAASGNDVSSVTVTAPTGITTGDLLLIVTANGTTGKGSSTGFTESTSSITGTVGVGEQSALTVLYKTAVLADESEANYTVNFPTSQGGVAYMFRITDSVSGDPVYFSSGGTVSIPTSGTVTVSASVSTERPSTQLHFIAAMAASDDPFDAGDIFIDSHQITSTDANPTWTALTQRDFLTGAGSSNYGTARVAYVASTDTSTVTGYGFRYGTDNDLARGNYLYFTLLTPLDASGSNTLTTTTVETFSGSGVTNVSAANTLATATGVSLTQAGTGETPTQWTNETKPSTTWTNET